MTRNSTICDAIDYRVLISFTYEEEGHVHARLAEPYVHGVTGPGNVAVLAYQTGGTSETEIPGWKTFILDRMTDLRRTSQPFTRIAPGYSHDDAHMSPVYCRVP